MSNQSSGEKTEQPTSKKVRDSRKRGQVARSQEVVTTLSLVGVIAWVWMSWDRSWERLVGLIDRAGGQYGKDFQSTALAETMFAFNECVAILLPLLGIVLVSGIAANYLQFGTIFSSENIKMKMENISPAKGAKKIFAVKQLVEMLKSIIKIVFLSTLLFYVVRDAIASYLNALWCGLICLSSLTSSVLLTTFLFSALAFVIVAVLDFIYQRHQHNKSLMMTKDEVKREYKESEGDPVVKGKRKQLAQELASGANVERTKTATALVVNPNHFAVAIKYDLEVAPLPYVVAKAVNMQAIELRAVAEMSGVPVFRNVPLARGIHAQTAIDDFIADEWFAAIAEILAWVKMNRRTLYGGPLRHGVIDMENGDHLSDTAKQSGRDV